MSSAIERLARVNARATRKFAELAQLNGRDIYGVYEDPYAADTYGQVGVASAAPTFVVSSDEVTGADHRTALTLRGVSYLVSNIEPDGFGNSLLRLEHA